ncbi:hypothetical protein F2Q70_00015185 [Brassica cretica]|uniref:Uncharacterized protein n=1 Tax=Brassica cretica TaxID=69181 RepID=A0A8S9I3E3_BRACR|nr:hypothetical protein F2Q70_00015185 [Brassica cretica]
MGLSLDRWCRMASVSRLSQVVAWFVVVLSLAVKMSVLVAWFLYLAGSDVGSSLFGVGLAVFQARHQRVLFWIHLKIYLDLFVLQYGWTDLSSSLSLMALERFRSLPASGSGRKVFFAESLIVTKFLTAMDAVSPLVEAKGYSQIKAKSLVAYPFNVVVAESSPMDASSGTTSTTSSARR